MRIRTEEYKMSLTQKTQYTFENDDIFTIERATPTSWLLLSRKASLAFSFRPTTSVTKSFVLAVLGKFYTGRIPFEKYTRVLK